LYVRVSGGTDPISPLPLLLLLAKQDSGPNKHLHHYSGDRFSHVCPFSEQRHDDAKSILAAWPKRLPLPQGPCPSEI
jgi:hypothetical protein